MAISTKDITIEENSNSFSSEDLPAKPKRGRPLGSKNAKTLLREAMVEKSEQKLLQDLNKVVDVVVEKAKDGDLTAAKMVWETFFKKAGMGDDIKKGSGGITINVTTVGENANNTGVTIEGKKARSEEVRSTDGSEAAYELEDE